MNLGIAFLRFGERESGTARLEEAVTAYRAALEEQTREREPLDWARTQMNLGTTLWRLGERERGTARLEEAVTAYNAALEVFVAAGADYYIDACRNNRNRTQALLAEKRT
jgi:exonuclease VII small subunit